MGLQTNSSQGFSRAAVFSIWGGSTARNIASGGVCQGWDDATPPATGEGGYGMSCVVPYSWANGSAYTFDLQFAGYGNGPQTYHDTNSQPGKWWSVTVSGYRIAEIFSPGRHRTNTNVHLLASRNYTFTEQFASLGACDLKGSLSATYDPPFVWNAGGRQSVDSDPTSRGNEPDLQCAGSQDWTWDSAKNSWGSVRFYK